MMLLPRRDCACASIAGHDRAMFIYTGNILTTKVSASGRLGIPASVNELFC